MESIIFAVLLLAVNAVDTQEEWNDFKLKHDKFYGNEIEEQRRYEIFRNNLKMISEHNAKYEAGLTTYWMGVNKFADMTSEELEAQLKPHNVRRPKRVGSRFVPRADAPDSIDWREKKAVVDVKDQGTCWSSWAFSAIGALEGQNAIINNKLVALSEQQLLDCSGSYGNGDCLTGGNMELAFDYVIDNGIETGEEYPYNITNPTKGICNANGTSVLAIKSYTNVDDNEEALKNAVGTIGPVSAGVYSVPIRFYSGGIFEDNSCVNDAWLIDQGVLIVGYDKSPSDYWIIKNSWGTDWGEKGYMRLARNSNKCGIALDTSYPVL